MNADMARSITSSARAAALKLIQLKAVSVLSEEDNRVLTMLIEEYEKNAVIYAEKSAHFKPKL